MRTTLRSIDPTLEASDDEEVLASGGDEAIRSGGRLEWMNSIF